MLISGVEKSDSIIHILVSVLLQILFPFRLLRSILSEDFLIFWIPIHQDAAVFQLLRHVWFSVTPWTAAHQAPLSFTISWSLLKLMSIESMRPSNHLILCHTLFLLPSIFPNSKGFSSESTFHIRWQKFWNFSFRLQIQSFQLIFRVDFL